MKAMFASLALLTTVVQVAWANNQAGQLSAPIPMARPSDAQGVPAAPKFLPPPPARGVTSRVDEVLERIERGLQNTPESDAALEQAVTRQMNLLQSTDKALRPVGYVEVGEQKYILISRDGKTLTRLREGSAMGPIKVTSLDESGVEYQVGEKKLFSPLSFQTSQPPEPPKNDRQRGMQSQGQGQNQPQGPVGR